jgi:hypothetical protein
MTLFDFRGPWFDSRTAQAYIPCKSLRGWYKWRDRHGIMPRANGSVAKADLDRALKTRKRTRQGLHPASQANLRLSRVHRHPRAMTTICGKCEYEWPTDSGRQVCPKCGNDGSIEGHVVREEIAS